MGAGDLSMIKYPSIDLADYGPPDPNLEPEEFDAALEDCLADPVWRICNIYTISDKEGKRIKFTPNWAQCVVLYHIYILGRKRNAIPKARQLGFSTLSELIAFDKAYWEHGQECCIIERSKDDAQEKMKIVLTAFEGLDPDLRQGAGKTTDNKGELSFSNDGSVVAGLNARGKNPQFLHISEWGVIAYEDPERSTEIKTGAIPAVSGRESVIIAESTFKGGRGGDWYNILKEGMEVAEEHRTERDWTILFFPWYLEPNYFLHGDTSQITDKVNHYLDLKEIELGIKFTPQQRLWYFKEQQPQNSGKWIRREYPTTMDEMWSVREDGQIYAAMMDKARLEGRVSNEIRHYGMLPTYAVFDIGAPENTKCVIFQMVGDRIIYLEALTGNGDNLTMPAEWWALLGKKKYSLSALILPHDAEHNSWERLFKMAGCDVTVLLDRPLKEWTNIVEAQSHFDRCEFHRDGCTVMDGDGNDIGLLSSLECFHCKVERDGVTVRDVPVHDWASHFCTAFGYSHQAAKDGHLVDRRSIPTHQGTVTKPSVNMQRKPRVKMR